MKTFHSIFGLFHGKMKLHFMVTVPQNIHNIYYWANGNSRLMRRNNYKHTFSVNLWYEIIGDKISYQLSCKQKHFPCK